MLQLAPVRERIGLLAALAALALTGTLARAEDPLPPEGGTSSPERSGDAPGEVAAALRPRAIAFLVVNGVYNTELTAPLDVLQHIRFHFREDWPETFLVSPDGRPVRSFEGMTIVPDHSFADAPDFDVLVVPSAEHSMDSDLDNAELIGWVKDRGRRARHVMSLCDGAFVLARAGLLEGVPATTFPADQDRFASMFPDVKLIRSVSFVDGGHALTSVGGARSFEVALWLVEKLWGREAAVGIARGLVIDWDPANIAHEVR